MSIVDKVKRVFKKTKAEVKEEIKEVEQFIEAEMIGIESKLDSLHLYHIEACKPQNDPQE